VQGGDRECDRFWNWPRFVSKSHVSVTGHNI